MSDPVLLDDTFQDYSELDITDDEIVRVCDDLRSTADVGVSPGNVPRAMPKRRRSWLAVVLVIGGLVVAAETAALVALRLDASPPARSVSRQQREQQAKAKALADLIMISESLEAHRREFGSYPELIEAILPRLPGGLVGGMRASEIVYVRVEAGRYELFFKGEGPHALVVKSDAGVQAVREVEP